MIVRWLIAQTIGPEQQPDIGVKVPYRVYYAGGGPSFFSFPDNVAEVEWLYQGISPKFVMSPDFSARFLRYRMAEEVAFCLAIEEPDLMGRLFVVRHVFRQPEWNPLPS